MGAETADLEPEWFTPVFVGRTADDEKIVLYVRNGNSNEFHILRPDGELWALSPGSDVVLIDNAERFSRALYVRSKEWTGVAIGSESELRDEPKR